MIIEGAISVKAAISSCKREINKVYINSEKKTKDFNYIRKLCREHRIEINEMANDELAILASGKTHGGILADVSSRKSDDLTSGDIFLIDGIEDPFNLGYMLRTLYAFGVNNVILANRDYSKMEAQLLKSSAGAFDFINIKYTDDFYTEVKSLKDKYYIYALKRDDSSKDVFECSFNKPALFMIGGEKRGISSNLEELCDEYLYIPYGNNFRNSLNAASALDVLATLLFNKRKHD